jgi:hypothetical protein
VKKKTIVICSSLVFVKKAFEIKDKLTKMGYRVILPKTYMKMKREGNFNVKDYKTWYVNDKDYKIKKMLINDHFKKIIAGDAILVINAKKNGADGYIGGNTLMEITIAYFYKKPIFILNNIPENHLFKEELMGIGAIFLNEDVGNIRL